MGRNFKSKKFFKLKQEYKKLKHESFFGCTFCPNRVFSTGKKSKIHMDQHNGSEIIQILPQSSRSSANEDYYGSNIEEWDEYESFEETGEQVNQIICQNWQPFKKLQEPINKSPYHKICLPKAETFQELSYISPKIVCKLCTVDVLFDDRHTAEEHIKTVHRFIAKEDLISKKIGKMGNKERLSFLCKVCSKMLWSMHTVKKHYPEHRYLYDKEQSNDKDNLKIETFLSIKFSCNLCKSLFVCVQKLMRMHVWERHFNEIQKNMDAIRETEKAILMRSETKVSDTFNQCSQGQNDSNAIPFEDSQSQTQIDRNNYFIPNDLLRKVGITEKSKTGIVIKKMEQMPEEVYSCCFCPHIILLFEDVKKHMHSHQFYEPRHYKDVVTAVPLVPLIETRTLKEISEVVTLSCICQHATFNKSVLSIFQLDEMYRRALSLDIKVKHLSGEHKLSMIYQSQFIQHNKYELLLPLKNKLNFQAPEKLIYAENNIPCITSVDGFGIAKMKNKLNYQPPEKLIYAENNIPSITSVDGFGIAKIHAVEIMELSTRKKFIIMKNLLREINITEQSRSAKPEQLHVSQLPEVVYSCFLCPHSTLLREKVPEHMKKHNLDREYGPLLTAVQVTPMIGRRLEGPRELVETNCVCQFAVFSTDVLSLPIINAMYEEAMSRNNLYVESKIDAKTKMLQVFKKGFFSHHPQKFVTNPNVQHYRNNDRSNPSELKLLKLHQIKEITESDGEQLNVVDSWSNNPESPQVDHDQPNVDTTTFKNSKKHVLVRDLLNKMSITKYNEHSDVETTLKQMPSDIYSCFFCPHVPMFSESDAKLHLHTKHKIAHNWSCLISSPIPIETLLDADSEDNIILECPCQYAIFNEEALRSPAIDTIYDELVSNYNYDKEEKIDSETKVTRFYLMDFTCHYRHRLIISSVGVKRQVESTSDTAKSKICKSGDFR